MEPVSYVDNRRAMVKKQLVRRGLRAPGVLAAMELVPRERFVPPSLQDEAYGDHAVAIDCGQTISQPYMVALMTEALELDGSQKVLEIGTGSGYQTAILAGLARTVISIERHGELSLQARRVLDQLGYTNIRLLIGDGTRGYPTEAPFDRIVVTAAAEHVPEALLEQLAEGGKLVIPVGTEPSQVLQSIRKVNGVAQVEELSNCRFVRLIGE